MQIPLVAFVGRLSGQKGMDVMLSALPALLGGPPRPLGGAHVFTRPPCHAASQALSHPVTLLPAMHLELLRPVPCRGTVCW